MKNHILKDTGKILHNRFVLYFVLFLALSDLLFLAMGSEFVSISIFFLSGFVTSFFSKNMMVIMCIALVVTNVIRSGTGVRMSEGLEMPNTEDEPTEDEPTEDEPTEDEPTEDEPPPTDVTLPTKKTTTVKKPVITEEEKSKFLENMEKLEMYEPLFTTMDKLMQKVGGLIGN